jgi:hypothetical protein
VHEVRVKFKKDEMGGAYSAHGSMTNAYTILVGKPEGRGHSEDVRRWEDNIKINLRKIGLEDVNWIHLALDRYR